MNGLGDTAEAIVATTTSFLLLYCNQVRGVPADKVGIALALGSIVNAAFDPPAMLGPTGQLLQKHRKASGDRLGADAPSYRLNGGAVSLMRTALQTMEVGL